MHGSRSKIASKNLVRQRCAEEFNSGVIGLIFNFCCLLRFELRGFILRQTVVYAVMVCFTCIGLSSLVDWKVYIEQTVL
jgi:hypothetical protein